MRWCRERVPETDAGGWPCAADRGGRQRCTGAADRRPRVAGVTAPLRVVAVVVAWNRRELLTECLAALEAQTRRVDAIVVVDNASTDGSADAAKQTADRADIVRMERNTGGAGGFTVGLHRALTAHAADVIWLMDDDTVPTPTALEELVAAFTRPGAPAVLACSRVVWTDGSDHPMNTPRPDPFASARTRERLAAEGLVPVRSASFVSMAVTADRVREVGLPIVDYFLWNDDFEFSTRVLRGQRGVAVLGSVVRHLTKRRGATDDDPGERFYFEVRNKLWMFRLSTGLTGREKLVYGASSLLRWVRTFAKSRSRRVLLSAFARGWKDGIRTRPRPNAEVLAGAGYPELSGGAADA
jgi:rhamnopyranosyl-N-acetylglucosaminyl-diphospho-decaprenol beta-1,3/1,4-galactofuranosyltransferase